jgi:O-antigen/teichoic acid export membrane protein
MGRTLFNLLFASFGYVAIRMVVAPVRIKLLTSLLSKEDYGLLTLIMLTVSFITVISSLGSLEFMLRKLPGRNTDFQTTTLRTIFTYFGLLAGTIAFVGVGILLFWQPEKLNLAPTQALACGLILVLTVHLTQLVYFLMGRSKYAQSRLLMLLYADAWFVPLLIFMWFTTITVGFMLWLWTFWLLASLCISQIWVRTRDLLRWRPSRSQFLEILGFGIPLLPMIMGEWIFQMQDRYVLLAFTDLESVANYTLCFNIAWVGAATGTSLLDLLITEFYKARNRVPSRNLATLLANAPLRKAFTLMLRYGLVLSLPIGLALWLARVPIILLLSAPKFADVAPLLRWVAPLPFLFLMSVIAGRTLVAMDRGKVVGAGTLCAAGLHLILSLVLTPVLAERGVALAECLAYGTLAVYLGLRGHLLRWIEWRELRPLRLLVYMAISGLGIHLAVMWLGNQHLAALLLGGVITLAAMLGLGLVHKADIRHLTESMHGPTEPDEAVRQEPFARD